jgi:hypothetical protein
LSEPEWIHLSEEQLTADPSLREAVQRFRAPLTPAGDAATEWLQNKALEEMDHVATYVALADGEVSAFYSLAMGEAELSSAHRKGVGASHPRAGAVLITWLARAEQAKIDAEEILHHAVGIARIGAREVGAAVIVVDPFDDATEEFWRQKFGFRRSRTKRKDANGEERARLWMRLLD